MDKETAETLEIRNFLSIKEVIWEIQSFNIITGDMGSGKSLCIKLVKFFEDIIPTLLVSPYESFLKHLDANQFFGYLIKEFTDIFSFTISGPGKQTAFRISYTFAYNGTSFDAIISKKDETNILFESIFLKNMLKEWYEYCEKKGSLFRKI
jgi:AAA15 family ATPase/GTPase